MPGQKRNYYEVLGVTPSADERTIKTAYRKIALKYHPDRNPNNPAAEDMFKEAGEAFSVLGDKEKRKQYDIGNNPFSFASMYREIISLATSALLNVWQVAGDGWAQVNNTPEEREKMKSFAEVGKKTWQNMMATPMPPLSRLQLYMKMPGAYLRYTAARFNSETVKSKTQDTCAMNKQVYANKDGMNALHQFVWNLGTQTGNSVLSEVFNACLRLSYEKAHRESRDYSTFVRHAKKQRALPETTM